MCDKTTVTAAVERNAFHVSNLEQSQFCASHVNTSLITAGLHRLIRFFFLFSERTFLHHSCFDFSSNHKENDSNKLASRSLDDPRVGSISRQVSNNGETIQYLQLVVGGLRLPAADTAAGERYAAITYSRSGRNKHRTAGQAGQAASG
jgi:hypothetical protein